MTDERCAIYLRISSDPEGTRAGVERQRKESLELAERLGLDVVQIYEDNDVSAYSRKPRPEFEAMMAAADAGEFTHVVAWASDRLYRQMRDLVRIADVFAERVQVHTVAGGDIDLDSADGMMSAQVKGSVAEFESRRKGERQRARVNQRVEAGVGISAIRPRGWAWADPCAGDDSCQHAKAHPANERPRMGSRAGLVLHPVEAPLLAIAYRRVASGWGLLATWRESSAAGLPLSGPTALRGALLSARNAGLVAHKGQVVREAANGLRIIDPETHARVTSILTDPRRRTSHNRATATPLGGGLLRCPSCDGPMAASNKYSRGGAVTPVYLCSRNRCHTKARHRLDGPVLDLVGEVLVTLADSGALLVTDEDTGELGKIRSDIEEKEFRLAEAQALATSGDLDMRDAAAITRALRIEIDALTSKLTRQAGRPALGELVADTDGIAVAFARLRDDGGEDLRVVLREVLERITYDVGTGDPLLTWKLDGPLPARITPPTPPPPARDARREEVARLWTGGVRTTVEIAKRLGITRHTARDDLAAMGLREILPRRGPKPPTPPKPAPLPTLEPVRLSGDEAAAWMVARTAEGYRRTEIAAALGVDRSTVLRALREAGVAPERKPRNR